jgi:hypothetical protein
LQVARLDAAPLAILLSRFFEYNSMDLFLFIGAAGGYGCRQLEPQPGAKHALLRFL